MRVIGTAGHVDHGKSTLVNALTGMNPDRLKEEQEREMTIDLGFAWMTLPSGEQVSLVDVPGHEAFIKNMLAGVGGIDAALLVVAADEGIMPQTREHLAILDLLRVKGGVVALTKVDLATEPGWLDLVEGEIMRSLEGTVLAGAALVPVSAKTGQGLDQLKQELDRALDRVDERGDQGKPRLPIDRVFSISGFGTVVTGTLTDGALEVGEEVEIAPAGVRARIRGIQTNKSKLTHASPGARTALNLVGVATDQVRRGDTVILPATYNPTQAVDARVEWLRSCPKSLQHNQTLDLFAFASEVSARVRLLQADELSPGETAWAQLVLSKPMILAKGDRFILRYPSPSITVGGGQVVEPHPSARHKRGRPEVIATLERLEGGTPTEIILQYFETKGVVERKGTISSGLAPGATEEAIRHLLEASDLIEVGRDHSQFLMSRAWWSRWRTHVGSILDGYHRQFPLRVGMPREELKSRLNLTSRIYDALLQKAASDNLLQFSDKAVWKASHQVEFDASLADRVNDLMLDLERAPFMPPSLDEAVAKVGPEALSALIEKGRIEKISEQVIMTPQAFETMRDWTVGAIKERGQVTAGELRDRFNTSRKYAIALLEYLDQKRVTKRVGDARVLR